MKKNYIKIIPTRNPSNLIVKFKEINVKVQYNTGYLIAQVVTIDLFFSFIFWLRVNILPFFIAKAL